MEYYRVGKLLSTHGLKGEIKVKVISDFDRFYKGSILYIYHRNEYVKVEVKDSKDYKEGLLVVFKGLEDINLIEKYKGEEIFIAEEDQGELEEGYYYHELIGKNVYNQDNVLRGVVEGIDEVPQGCLLCVKVDGKIKKIPFVEGVFIKEVKEDSIIINEIEGLL